MITEEKFIDKTYYPAFENAPFESRLVDERGGTFVHENWKYGLGGKALNTSIGETTFGAQTQLLDENGELTENGKLFEQWASWFISGNDLSRMLRERNHTDLADNLDKWEQFYLTQLEAAGIDIGKITAAKNIAFLKSLQQTGLQFQPTDLDILSGRDLTVLPITNAYNVVETQPGYWGAKTKRKQQEYAAKYGDDWSVGFEVNGNILTSPQFSERFYQQVLLDYFRNYPEQLSFITNTAKALWEDELESDLGMVYDITSYRGKTKHVFSMVNRFALINGLNFKGSEFMAIRGMRADDLNAGDVYNDVLGRLGRILHAGAIAVPKSLQAGIMPKSDNLHGWWEKWETDSSVVNSDRFKPDMYGDNLVTLEEVYHRAKVIIARKNPDISLLQDLLD